MTYTSIFFLSWNVKPHKLADQTYENKSLVIHMSHTPKFWPSVSSQGNNSHGAVWLGKCPESHKVRDSWAAVAAFPLCWSYWVNVRRLSSETISVSFSLNIRIVPITALSVIFRIRNVWLLHIYWQLFSLIARSVLTIQLLWDAN